MESAADLTSFNIRKTELVRVILQALESLNYSESARALEKESGIALHVPVVNEFRQHVLMGDWDKVIHSLPQVGLTEKHKVQNVKFLIYRQKYLELLDSKKAGEALQTLRQELAPMTRDSTQLHKLASLIMCQSSEDLMRRTKWQTPVQLSRQELLNDLHKYIPSTMMIPENRLQKLLLQAIEPHQSSSLSFGEKAAAVPPAPISLLDEEISPTETLPRDCIHVLEHHTDEVWHVQFSPNGQYLATCSADKTASILEVAKLGEKDYKPLVLQGHSDAVILASWSPDSSMLITCGNDKKANLWKASTGALAHTFQKYKDPVVGIAWLSDNVHFYTAGSKNDKTIRKWNAQTGEQVESWKVAYRIHDLAISSDESKLVVVGHNKRLYVYSPHDKGNYFYVSDTEYLTSVTLSSCGKFALCSLSREDGDSGKGGLHLWDLDERRLVQEYLGNRQIKYVLRNAFGGKQESLLVCGSEDNKIYMWDRQSGRILASLNEHSNSVCSIAWNPKCTFTFASASDDHTVRIWSFVDRIKDL